MKDGIRPDPIPRNLGHSHCVEEFPKRVGIGGLGGVGNPRQKVSIA